MILNKYLSEIHHFTAESGSQFGISKHHDCCGNIYFLFTESLEPVIHWAVIHYFGE